MALQLAKYIFSLPFIPPSYFAHLLRSQLFTTLPLPTTSYTSKTIIITGANGGLGLEAARHYVRLGAARVILACRSTERGEKAKASIVLPPPRDDGQTQIIEVWPLDLCSFESVKSFCKRAQKELDRLDVLLLNAGVAMGDFELSDGGYETTITTNVISTFLVAVLLLPLLRRTGIERNEESHLTVVASEAHYFTAFKERHEDKMFEAFKKNDQFYWGDRYGVSKLLDLLLAREMAERLDRRAGGAGKIPIIVNSVNPGLCGATALFRSVPWFVGVILSVLSWIMARSSDQGARILMAAAEGGKETHGKYIDSGKVHDPSPFVLSEEGKQAGKKAWVELMDILESIEPGSTFMLG